MACVIAYPIKNTGAPADNQHDMRRLALLLGLCGLVSVVLAQSSGIIWRQPLLSGRAMALSPNGQLLALAAEGGQIALYRVSDRQLVRLLSGHAGSVQALAFAPNSQRLASLDDFGNLRLWNVDTGALVWSVDASGTEISLAFAPDGSTIATGGTNQRIVLWNATNGAPLRTLTGHGSAVSALAFSPNGAYLASGDWIGELRIWNPTSGSLVHTEGGAHLDAINALAWSPDGAWLASGSSDTRVRLWTAGTWMLERTLTAHTDSVNTLAFSADSAALFSASADATIRQWDPISGTEVRTFNGHTGIVRGVGVLGSTQLVSTAEDRTARFWQISTGNTTATIQGHAGAVRGVAFVSGGYALSGDEQGILRLWNASNGSAGPNLTPHPNPVLTLAASPDGTLAAIGDFTGTVSLRAMPTGATLATWSAHSEEVLALAFSPNGQLLATAGFDGTAKLWQLPGGTLLRTFGGHTGTVNAVAFSPDGTQLATGDSSGAIRIWNLDGTLQATINAHSDPITGLAFRPTGSHLASCSTDGTVRIWDLATYTPFRTLTGDGFIMAAVAYTPDGAQIIASDYSGTLRLWDASTGDLVRQTSVHAGEARALALSADGAYTLSGGTDGLVMLYTAGPPNQPPNIPTLINPVSGASVSRTPTFEVQLSDPDGNQVRATIEVVDSQNQSRMLQTGWTAGGSVSVSIPANQPLTPGAYQWRARAEDVHGATSAPSEWRTFTVSNNAPGKPTILEPGDNAQVSATPTFRLRLNDPDSDRVKAHIEILQGSTTLHAYETDLVANGQEVTFTVPEADALPPGTYQWRTRAEDAYGARSDWTANRTFTIAGANRPPDVPIRLSPSDGSTTGTTPTFRLRLSDPDSNTVRAEIEIVSALGAQRLYQTIEVSSGSEVSFTIPDSEPLVEGTYLWRARARDSVGDWSDWTDQWQFTVAQSNQPPSPPTLLEPADGATLTTPTPTFRLQLSDPDNEQVHAVIRISRTDGWSAEFQTGAVASGQTVNFTVPNTQALESGDYVWQARAIDARNAQSDWSQPRSFSINFAPNAPTLISPAPNAFTSRTPVLRVRAEDPEGDAVLIEIELSDGSHTWRYTTDSVPSGAVVPYPIPEASPLNAGQITWRARAQDSLGTWGAWSAAQTFHAMNEITPQVIGVTDFALNLNIPNATPDRLGLNTARLMRWNAQSGNYESVTTLRPGEGYFLKVNTTTRLDLTGEPVNGTFTIDLQPGWNLIANPYLLPVIWNLDAIQVRRNGTTLSLREARAAGWLEDYLWTWRQDPNDPTRGRYHLVYDPQLLPNAEGALEPWQAYWILAREACTLVFNPPSRSRSLMPKPNGWTLALQAIGANGQSEAVLGVGRALRASTPPDAPDQQGAPTVRIVRPEGAFSADIREAGTRAPRWQVEVIVPPAGSAQVITLTARGAHHLPHNTNLALIDEQTGKRIPLRGAPRYTFTAPPEGGRYQFRIEPVSARAFLRILNPAVQGGRGQGGRYQISFTLTGEARVQVQIRTAGQVVRTLEAQASRSEGTHQLVWDGRDNSGRALPPGQYLVEITAISEEGQVARAVVPLVSTR